MRYVFDTFVIDAAKRELIAAGTPLRVEPKVLDLLLYLIECRDRVVSKDELVNAVWQGRFISDAAISSSVAAARRALSDDGREQRYLRTAHGRGFRFVGSLVEVGSKASKSAAAPLGWPSFTPRLLATLSASLVRLEIASRSCCDTSAMMPSVRSFPSGKST